MGFGPFQDYCDKKHPAWRFGLKFSGVGKTLRAFVRTIYRRLNVEEAEDFKEWGIKRLQREHINRTAEVFVYEKNRIVWQILKEKETYLETHRQTHYQSGKAAVKKSPRPHDEQTELF